MHIIHPIATCIIVIIHTFNHHYNYCIEHKLSQSLTMLLCSRNIIMQCHMHVNVVNSYNNCCIVLQVRTTHKESMYSCLLSARSQLLVHNPLGTVLN